LPKLFAVIRFSRSADDATINEEAWQLEQHVIARGQAKNSGTHSRYTIWQKEKRLRETINSDHHAVARPAFVAPIALGTPFFLLYLIIGLKRLAAVVLNMPSYARRSKSLPARPGRVHRHGAERLHGASIRQRWLCANALCAFGPSASSLRFLKRTGRERVGSDRETKDRVDFVREGFAKVQADFDFLCELLCGVVEETKAGKEIAEFIRQCFTADAPAPENDIENNPIRRCQALSIAFQLLNIVEENTTNQMRRRREGPQSESEPGLWLHDLHDLVARGFSEDAVRAAVVKPRSSRC
jgi:hypothetical protein